MRLMIFCSNPVGGGTARIFYETVIGLQKKLGYDSIIYPCIDQHNDVKIYHKLPNLVELPIIAEQNLCKGMYGGGFIRKIYYKVFRTLKYRRFKKNNIELIEDFIRTEKIDAVLIHNGGYVGDDLCNQVLVAAYNCRDLVRKRIYIFHNDMKKGIIRKLRYLPYDKGVSRKATKLVTVSKYTRNRILKSSFISKDIDVIYNGIDVNCEKKTSSRNIVLLSKDQKNVLMIGNFLANKGQKNFIEVANALSKVKTDIHFSIIGNVYDKEYFEQCLRLIDDYGLEGTVSIYHGINNASDYIDNFDVMVVPSLYDESFGLISVEGMAKGIPVVAFACGGIPEVVENGRDGFVVPIGDDKSMADKIAWLLEHEGERKTMAKNCWADYVAKYTPEAMVQQYVNLLME